MAALVFTSSGPSLKSEATDERRVVLAQVVTSSESEATDEGVAVLASVVLVVTSYDPSAVESDETDVVEAETSEAEKTGPGVGGCRGVGKR